MNLILSVNAQRVMMHVKFEMTFENGNFAFYTFSVFSLFLNVVHHKNRVRSIT